MIQRSAIIGSSVGLHARPAATFVQAAGKIPGEVTVAKPGAGPVNAKSILAVLGLDARHGDEITLTADDGQDDALTALAELVARVE